MIQQLRRLLPRATNQGSLAAGVDEPLPLAVLEFQSPTAAVIATPLPPIARSTSHVLSALVAVLLVIAATMRFDQQVVGAAVMNSSTPDFSIQAFNTSSILRNISVHPGQIVKQGEVVATLDPTYTSADLTGLTEQQQNYAAQVAQLQAQEANKPYVPDPNNPYAALQLQTYNQQMGQYNFTMQNYQQQINQLQTQINGYNSQADYYRQRLGIAANVETMRKKLQSLQVGSELDTEAATDDRVSMQAQMEQNISEASAAEKQVASVTAQMNSFAQQFRAQTSTQLATALNQLSETQASLTKAKLDSQQVDLRAPQDAVVQSVAQAAIGSVLQPGQTLLTLSPVNSPFVVSAEIDATESGYVRVGDRVDIEFATLPQAVYGSAMGTVTSISASSFNPQDQQANATTGTPLPGTPQNLYYKASISLDQINLHDVPSGFRLMPGMPINAYIIVGRQTFLQWLFKRYSTIVSNAFHEP
jgi:HlyD family secretion protein